MESIALIGAGGLLMLISPPTGLVQVRLWESGAQWLSLLVNGLLLAVLFFLILSSLAILRRMISRDSAAHVFPRIRPIIRKRKRNMT